MPSINPGSADIAAIVSYLEARAAK